MKLVASLLLLVACGVEEQSEATSALGPGWCHEAEVIVTVPAGMNVEEPFVRVTGSLVTLYFSDRTPSEARDLHRAVWNGAAFMYQGQVGGVNTPLGLEGAPSIDAQGGFYFTNAALPGMIARGTLLGTSFVANAAAIPGMPAAGPRGTLFDGNMDIGVAPAHPFALLSRATWANPPGGLPLAADLWYLRRSATAVAHVPIETLYFLGALNTPDALEYAPELSADGLAVYFTRTWPSLLTSAIMTARRSSLTAPFGAPSFVIPPGGLVEGPTVFPGNDRILFHRVTPGAPTRLFTVQRC